MELPLLRKLLDHVEVLPFELALELLPVLSEPAVKSLDSLKNGSTYSLLILFQDLNFLQQTPSLLYLFLDLSKEADVEVNRREHFVFNPTFIKLVGSFA
jgi:hypothetical protein